MNSGGDTTNKLSVLAAAKNDDGEPKIVKKNDIRDLKKISQLARVNLDLDSPRMKEAIDRLGVSPDELEKK